MEGGRLRGWEGLKKQKIKDFCHGFARIGTDEKLI